MENDTRTLLERALAALEGSIQAGRTIEYYSHPSLKPLSATNYRTMVELGYKKEDLVDIAIRDIRAKLAQGG
jgi:hypothetical protein